MKGKSIITLVSVILFISCQPPFYYKIKKIEGTIYDKDNNSIFIDFHSRRKLLIYNSSDSEINLFLRTLNLAKHGRIELEHLLTTSAKINIEISEKIGIMFKNGKYRLMGGMTGSENNQSDSLIINEINLTPWVMLFNKKKYLWVYEENTIEIFKGSVNYINDSSFNLNNSNIKLFDWHTNKEITSFSIDTIKIEDLMYPDMMYKNLKELFYFTGLHEIYHTRPENIEIQEYKGDSEFDAIELEEKAFKKRKTINKRKIKQPTTNNG